jgi:hypothetical protein
MCSFLKMKQPKRTVGGDVCKLNLSGHIDNDYDIVYLSDGIVCSVSGGVT